MARTRSTTDQHALALIFLAVVGCFLSYHASILSVSLLYAAPLVAFPLDPSSVRFLQVAPIFFLVVLTRFIPLFIGSVLATLKKPPSLLWIGVFGGLYEAARALALALSWHNRIPELNILLFQNNRVYTWVHTQVSPAVLELLYPVPARVLAAGVLAVLGAMIIRWSGRSKKTWWYRWFFLFLAGLVVILAT